MPVAHRRSFLLCLPLFLTAVAAYAQSCQTYLFPYTVQDAALAIVKTPREPILRDEEGCLGGSARCASHSYLIAGNRVLTAHIRNGYRCIAFFNGKSQTTGWVHQDALTPATPAPANAAWQGNWTRQSGDARIVIRKRGDRLYASATATLAVNRDNVRTGGAEGTLTSQGNSTASFGEAGDRSTVCRVHLRLLEDVLLADDGATDDANSSCGGMGVSLNGIYRRTTK
jgi:hypothetical protein